MSESQSRYSIVERLTRDKLNIMDNKDMMKSQLEKEKSRIAKLKEDRNIKKLSLEANMAEELGCFDSEIRQIEAGIKNLEANKESYVKNCDEKIKQLDLALKAVADISRASAEEAKN